MTAGGAQEAELKEQTKDCSANVKSRSSVTVNGSEQGALSWMGVWSSFSLEALVFQKWNWTKYTDFTLLMAPMTPTTMPESDPYIAPAC